MNAQKKPETNLTDLVEKIAIVVISAVLLTAAWIMIFRFEWILWMFQ